MLTYYFLTGGMGAISDSIAASAINSGAEIVTNATVKRILSKGNGNGNGGNRERTRARTRKKDRKREREKERERERERVWEREKDTESKRDFQFSALDIDAKSFTAIMTFIFAFKLEDYLLIGF